MQAASRYKNQTHILDTRLVLLTETSDELNNNFTYTAKHGELWTDLAWRFLGDAQYYWVIAELNNTLNPFIPLEAGQQILIPPQSIIQRL